MSDRVSYKRMFFSFHAVKANLEDQVKAPPKGGHLWMDGYLEKNSNFG